MTTLQTRNRSITEHLNQWLLTGARLVPRGNLAAWRHLGSDSAGAGDPVLPWATSPQSPGMLISCLSSRTAHTRQPAGSVSALLRLQNPALNQMVYNLERFLTWGRSDYVRVKKQLSFNEGQTLFTTCSRPRSSPLQVLHGFPGDIDQFLFFSREKAGAPFHRWFQFLAPSWRWGIVASGRTALTRNTELQITGVQVGF